MHMLIHLHLCINCLSWSVGCYRRDKDHGIMSSLILCNNAHCLQLFWFVPTNTVSWLQYASLEAEAATALQSEDQSTVQAASISDEAQAPDLSVSGPLQESPAPNLAPGRSHYSA